MVKEQSDDAINFSSLKLELTYNASTVCKLNYWIGKINEARGGGWKAWYCYPCWLSEHMKQEYFANQTQHKQGCDITKAWFDGQTCSSPSDFQDLKCVWWPFLWHLKNSFRKAGIPTHINWANRLGKNDIPTNSNTCKAVIWLRHGLMGGLAPWLPDFQRCGIERKDEARIISLPNSIRERLWYDQGMVWWADLLLTIWLSKMWNMSPECFCDIWKTILAMLK